MDVVSALLSFFLVAALLTIIPGLDTALVLRSAITHSRRHAVATALGVVCGALVWGAAAAVGASALLTASETGYLVLRLAGAAYLVWFGASILWRSWRRRAELSEVVGELREAPVARAGGLVGAWSRGVLTNLLNPKVGVFYLAVIPQFIPEGASALGMGLLLALVHGLQAFGWFSLLILLTRLTRRWLNRAVVRRAMDRITGAVLVAFGLRLALSDG